MTRRVLTVVSTTLIVGTALFAWQVREAEPPPARATTMPAGTGVAGATTSDGDRVVLTIEEGKSPATYRAELHQRALKTPLRWCAEPRFDEPLWREAQLLANGDDGNFSTMRAVIKLPPVSADAIQTVSDEAACEAAARNYDDMVYSGAVNVQEHATLLQVLVIRVGAVFLVDDLRERARVWDVIVFDAAWNLQDHYGGGS